jgi:hypothetical protein
VENLKKSLYALKLFELLFKPLSEILWKLFEVFQKYTIIFFMLKKFHRIFQEKERRL